MASVIAFRVAWSTVRPMNGREAPPTSSGGAVEPDTCTPVRTKGAKGARSAAAGVGSRGGTTRVGAWAPRRDAVGTVAVDQAAAHLGVGRRGRCGRHGK